MAEEKKDFKDKKDAPPKEEKPAPKADAATDATGILILVILFMGVSTAVGGFFATRGGFSVDGVLNYFLNLIPDYVILFIRRLTASYIIFVNLLSFIFVIGIVYSFIKWRKVEDKWYAALYPTPVPMDEISEKKNQKWERIVAHISSDNSSDWRLAILEADIMLDDLLDHLGYVGDTIGDKLKKAVRGDFKTIDQAWEAHKIRNAIAHEGSDFILTQRDAQRIIGLYEDVFREFDFI
ncbi:MAG: hypothetical protein V4519_01130 [Patescibacteria group bacterium]